MRVRYRLVRTPSRVSRAVWITLAAGIAMHPGSGVASSFDVQGENVNTGLFAARVDVASSCTADLHAILSGPIAAGDYIGCSTLTADADLASGAATFTAGDLVILRDGFSVATGGTLTVEIDRDLYPDAWVQDDTPDGETIYAARFYLDASSLDVASLEGQRFFPFVARAVVGNVDADPEPEAYSVGIRGASSDLLLFFEMVEDDGSVVTTEGTGLEFAVGPGWHQVDLQWQASTSPEAHDGTGFLCLDSPAPPLGCVALSDLDNDTGAIDFVRWGCQFSIFIRSCEPADLERG
ncbi:MAG: hypothetical protein AMS19_05935 [Gemmatimonas sp. SG8_23]|nr:MAG: hypothetical protein AMS19_05935 [Gemmatimonas sp. SG8_23]